ncbi:hypothetical protein HLB23_40230 [Nocardia uniformis]|uniref:Uncharacterized protein n=1 Tax=Nocardia uniformis TaxID=53432 RepID=A0A849CL24_9NOCA|nr:hypothetical protein [Nocardia uniformis]NNH76011.1 hypothetical protein [Nocardia uniformis]
MGADLLCGAHCGTRRRELSGLLDFRIAKAIPGSNLAQLLNTTTDAGGVLARELPATLPQNTFDVSAPSTSASADTPIYSHCAADSLNSASGA